MPFTVSHAAAVLPLHRHTKLPLTALMVGSMAPDFGYFFSHEASRELTHSFTGLFIFALPAGLFVWLFYVAFLEKATITLLSDRWHTRFAHTDAITLPLIARASIAILLGAVTHLLWDAVTHRYTFVTNALPILAEPTPGLAWLPIYHLLHFLSSVVGLVILARWAQHLHRQPAKSLIRPYKLSERARVGALWILLVASLGGGLWDWLPYAGAHYSAQFFFAAVGTMSGFFIAWCCIAVGMWINARYR
jgi:sorbitol-specific phosphotransferase system component IIC